MQPAVQLDDISFSYYGRPVLRGASFALAPGELCALVGPNGAGKSTIIKLVLGELAPVRGDISVLGRNPVASRFDGTVGYVPQQAPDDYRKFPATVMEVVMATLPKSSPLLHGRSARKGAALKALSAAGVGELSGRLIGELSGGQFQRALLARAIASNPQLLLLDEPTSSLDDESADSLVRCVSRISKEYGAAVLLVTHDLARMPSLFDRILSLSGGAIEPIPSGQA